MKYRILPSLIVAAYLGLLLTGCEKKEQPITLPPKGNAIPGRVNIGADYATQVFYDIESNSVVKTSLYQSWDLAFETGKTGYHVWMNGGKQIFLSNTHQTEFAPIDASGITSWAFDDPSGNPDSTAMRDWLDQATGSKKEVYVVKLADNDYRQIRMVSVNDSAYTMEWADQNATYIHSITLPKDDAYSYTYFSFENGMVTPDPPKDSWDIVFTRYRHIYRDLDNMAYYVNGALLNPNHTSAARDSVDVFENIDTKVAGTLAQSSARDAIGFEWKKYNFNDGRYVVNKNYNFVIHTRNGQVYKLHFLDFYSPTGASGSPSFETERLQ